MNMLQRAVEPLDLFQLRFLQEIAVCSSTGRIVFSLSSHNADQDAVHCHLWLLHPESGVQRRLTHGQHSDNGPAWSPNGTEIAFISTRTGVPQIFVLPIDGGEARQLTDFEQGVGGGPVWAPDGRRLAFTAGAAGLPPEQEPYRISRHVMRADGLGYVDRHAQDIYQIDADGGNPVQLTDDGCHNYAPQWAPDGSALLYMAMWAPDTHAGIYPELRVVTPAGSKKHVVAGSWGHTGGSAAWLPDSRHIAVMAVEADRPHGAKFDLYVVDAVGEGSPENRTPNHELGVGRRLQADMPSAFAFDAARIFVDATGAHAYVRVQRGGDVEIHRIALSGAEAHMPVVQGERSCFPIGLTPGDTGIVFAASDMNRPFDLFTCDLDGDNARRLTDLNGHFLTGIRQPEYKRLTFTGRDGAAVEGWLIMPQDGEAPYPTILYIHGGPHSAFGHVFHFDTQMLTGAGFAVLMINHRASTGYGDAFATAIRGDWGNLDYGDLMAGVDAAVDRGLANPERLGVCGLSGGGNLSCWIVGHSDRFKAAVPENPLTNWQSFYGVSDVGVWFSVQELGGHPHEIPGVYARCSPITFAHRCRTPTLLIQCESDWRCPAEQSEQFYAVLKANGCPVEMLRLPGGSHAGAITGAPILRRAQNAALLDWMNRHV